MNVHEKATLKEYLKRRLIGVSQGGFVTPLLEDLVKAFDDLAALTDMLAADSAKLNKVNPKLYKGFVWEYLDNYLIRIRQKTNERTPLTKRVGLKRQPVKN